MAIPTRILGRTGQRVTILGLDGEGFIRTFGQDKYACVLVNRALDLGITYGESERTCSGSGGRSSFSPAKPMGSSRAS